MPLSFDDYTAALTEACDAHPALDGLVLLGSGGAPERRDEWSDHDFFALAPVGRGEEARTDLDWLPYQEHLVATAREGGIGFTALYDDGHVFEFAVATLAELGDARVNDAAVVIDPRGEVARLVEEGRERTRAAHVDDAGNEIRLALVKVVVGVGRVRRGEVINGGHLIRTYALTHLLRAIRARITVADSVRDTIDPVRRFELDYPRLGRDVAAALDLPPEAGARALLDIARRELEPGWPGFPSRAADVVAARFVW